MSEPKYKVTAEDLRKVRESSEEYLSFYNRFMSNFIDSENHRLHMQNPGMFPPSTIAYNPYKYKSERR